VKQICNVLCMNFYNLPNAECLAIMFVIIDTRMYLMQTLQQ